MNTLTRAFAETFQGAWYHSPVEVLATPSTRRITLQPASQELTLPRTARGKKGRHARNTDSEDNLQADGEAVKKVTVHEASTLPKVDTTVKTLLVGLWLGGGRVPYHALD